MSDPTARVTPMAEMVRRGCGYMCPYRDWVSGLCEKHGPTEADLIVQKMTDAFADDLRRILRRRLTKHHPGDRYGGR